MTLDPTYRRQRNRTLAYGAASAPVDLLGSFVEPWTAESEDFANVADALTVYGEQQQRDADIMLFYATAPRAIWFNVRNRHASLAFVGAGMLA